MTVARAAEGSRSLMRACVGSRRAAPPAHHEERPQTRKGDRTRRWDRARQHAHLLDLHSTRGRVEVEGQGRAEDGDEAEAIEPAVDLPGRIDGPEGAEGRVAEVQASVVVDDGLDDPVERDRTVGLDRRNGCEVDEVAVEDAGHDARGGRAAVPGVYGQVSRDAAADRHVLKL